MPRNKWLQQDSRIVSRRSDWRGMDVTEVGRGIKVFIWYLHWSVVPLPSSSSGVSNSRHSGPRQLTCGLLQGRDGHPNPLKEGAELRALQGLPFGWEIWVWLPSSVFVTLKIQLLCEISLSTSTSFWKHIWVFICLSVCLFFFKVH